MLVALLLVSVCFLVAEEGFGMEDDMAPLGWTVVPLLGQYILDDYSNGHTTLEGAQGVGAAFMVILAIFCCADGVTLANKHKY